jgi:hypothetical protein
VHSVSDVKHIELHTVELLLPDPSPFEVEIAIAKLKRYKSTGGDQILAELNQAGGETLWSEIHKHVNSIWSKEELPDEWKESLLYQFTRRAIKLAVVIIMEYWRKNGSKMKQYISYFIAIMKAYDSVRREVLYSILIDFGVPMKLVSLIKICLNEMYSKVHVGKQLSDSFPFQNVLKQGDALLPLLFNFALEYAIRKVQETRWD